MSKRAESSRSTEEALLEAAAAVFGERGYEGAGIHEIVKRAGLTTGAVYRRFDSKDDLLSAAVVSRAATRQLEGYSAEQFDTVADFLVFAGKASRPLNRDGAMLVEAFACARRVPRVRKGLAANARAWRQSVEPLIEAGVEDGSIDPSLDPDAVAYLMRIIGLGVLLARAGSVSAPEPQGWARVMSRVVKSLSKERSPAPARRRRA